MSNFKLSSLNLKQQRFVNAVIEHGGNISEAARDVGYNIRYAYDLIKHPAIQASLQAAQEANEQALQDWANLAVKAQQRLAELLDAENTEVDEEGNVHTYPDNRTRLGAVKEVLDRHLGKAAQKIEHEGEVIGVSLDGGTLKAIMALMLFRGLSVADARKFVQDNPQEVNNWLKAPKVLETVDAEVIDND